MRLRIPAVACLALTLAACGGHGHDHDHPHDDGTEGSSAHSEEEGEHDHEIVSLGTATIGELEVEFGQGHGAVEAGKESHLEVKLPYSDDGSTIVRAWLGTDDRTLSLVGKGEFSASHGDYEIHATAPDPLPEGTLWWVELEKPDGTKLVGSVAPKFE